MCRNIKLLHDLRPPATAEEIQLSAVQYVRKLSGMRSPSQANRQVFERAVSEVVAASTRLLRALEPGRPHTREELRLKAVERGRRREAQNRARVLATLDASVRRHVHTKRAARSVMPSSAPVRESPRARRSRA